MNTPEIIPLLKKELIMPSTGFSGAVYTLPQKTLLTIPRKLQFTSCSLFSFLRKSHKDGKPTDMDAHQKRSKNSRKSKNKLNALKKVNHTNKSIKNQTFQKSNLTESSSLLVKLDKKFTELNPSIENKPNKSRNKDLRTLLKLESAESIWPNSEMD